MAAEAFAATAVYDAEIAGWFAGEDPDACGCGHHHDHGEEEQILGVELRYGENPHQHAELVLPGDDPEAPLAAMGLRQLGGKELSYNNLVDVVAAVKLVDDLEGIRCAALKHTNPCGVGLGGTPVDALARALRCDPVSAFGGIFVFSHEVDAPAADILRRRFCEVVLAPSFTDEALETLQRKKNVRELTVDFDVFREATRGQARAFGIVELHQDEDEGFPELETWVHAAGPEPDADRPRRAAAELDRLQARQEQRDRAGRRERDARHRGRPDEPRRQRADRGAQGGRPGPRPAGLRLRFATPSSRSPTASNSCTRRACAPPSRPGARCATRRSPPPPRSWGSP